MSVEVCKLCKTPMLSKLDCGGDCVFCMAELGDPDCKVSAMQHGRQLMRSLVNLRELITERHTQAWIKDGNTLLADSLKELLDRSGEHDRVTAPIRSALE